MAHDQVPIVIIILFVTAQAGCISLEEHLYDVNAVCHPERSEGSPGRVGDSHLHCVPAQVSVAKEALLRVTSLSSYYYSYKLIPF